MNRAHGIDVGSSQSAFVTWNGTFHSNAHILANDTLLDLIRDTPLKGQAVGIEQVRSYGGIMGNEMVDTIFWSGVFWEAATMQGAKVIMVPRKRVAAHVCGITTVGDTQINQALRAKYGSALKGITSHLYAALGVADYVLSLDQSATTPQEI